ncbi:MAG: putative toxin-antitoxin system toxin component, PIN family [Deltaproteobacteria bacterium]|nr:putative toxin-antitoxin system toxin component, PIN family [Deltaproteobacteria bacterium]
MKIILDTNVFISGIFFTGPPSQILNAWQDSRLQILLSQEIINEYQRVAESLSAEFPTIDILPIIELMTIHGQLIDTEGFDVSVCDDPDDNKFMECAIAGNSEMIISGDKHLLRVSGYRGITVLKPREFVDRYLK